MFSDASAAGFTDIGLGGFSSSPYWSSVETSPSQAFYVGMGDGHVFFTIKSLDFPVRPVMGFKY